MVEMVFENQDVCCRITYLPLVGRQQRAGGHNTIREFGIKHNCYASCHIVVVGEIAIRFYLFLSPKHRILSRIHVMPYHWYGTINGKWVGGRCLDLPRER